MNTHIITKKTLPYTIPICLECRTVFQLINLKINYKNELSLHYKCQCSDKKYVNFDSYYYGLNLLKNLERKKCPEETFSLYYCLDCKNYFSFSNRKKHSSHFLSDYYIKDYYLMCPLHQTKKVLYYCMTCKTLICSVCKNLTHKKHKLYILSGYNIETIKQNIKASLMKNSIKESVVNKVNILIALYLNVLKANNNYINYYLLTSFKNLSKIEYTTAKINFIQNNRLNFVDCKTFIIFQDSTIPFHFEIAHKAIVRNVISLPNETYLFYILLVVENK